MAREGAQLGFFVALRVGCSLYSVIFPRQQAQPLLTGPISTGPAHHEQKKVTIQQWRQKKQKQNA